jgi:hypothetical protein
LKLNGTHQIIVYTDDFNILGGNVHKRKTQKLLVVANELTGLEVKKLIKLSIWPYLEIRMKDKVTI